jgi:predicted ATPase with chaperone activity
MRAALSALGLALPARRIIVNLAPAVSSSSPFRLPETAYWP